MSIRPASPRRALVAAVAIGLMAAAWDGASLSGARQAGPPVQGAEEDIPLVARFDANRNRRLDYSERTAAREYLRAHPELRRHSASRSGWRWPRASHF